ncbi:hypothetical protein P9112_006887 [Eukaryota sp. TZLM1-RC]
MRVSKPIQAAARRSTSSSFSMQFLPLESTSDSSLDNSYPSNPTHKSRRSIDLSARSHLSSNANEDLVSSTGTIQLLSPSPSSKTRLSEDPQKPLEQCPKCKRQFHADRIGKHSSVCKAKPLSKHKRHHSEKTESPSQSARDSKPKKWELQSNHLRAMIRANKGLPPEEGVPLPPPVDTVSCPHCNRKFSESAAERHIPICSRVIHRPKPPSKNVSRVAYDPAFAARSSLSLSSSSPSSTSTPQARSSKPRIARSAPVSKASLQPSGGYEAKYCTECGEKFTNSGYKFCPFCGTCRYNGKS